MGLIDIDNLKEQIDVLTWYHINSKGDLVGGAESREKALYKATDIYMLIDNAPTVDIWKIRQEASENGFKKAESLYKRPQNLWIPIEYRPMSEFEYNEFLAAYGYLEPEERKMFCCQMPEDQQEILISTKWGVCLDKCEIDLDDNDNPVYGLEERGDWDGVMAWMPLPEQYKGGEKK